MSSSGKVNSEVNILAAIAYGEASTRDVPEEMAAIAKVMVRQRNARGYPDIGTFVTVDKTFSFVVNDGNPRFKRFMTSNEAFIAKNLGMSTALDAAKSALSGTGSDPSNGAYFWDGADIKSNYREHYKVKHGIRFSDTARNIYGIDESTKLVILTKTVTKIKKGKVISSQTFEVSRYDHVYLSTAAYGGTIFWKFDPKYLAATGAKEYK